jgi:hypothetical protein
MIRWRVRKIVKRFAGNSDDVRPTNFERVRGFDVEWKLLCRPSEHYLPNLTPLWANRNFGADRSGIASGSVYKRIARGCDDSYRCRGHGWKCRGGFRCLTRHKISDRDCCEA